jgi:APA family basic amino acid/polyamine antiporter
MQSLRRDLGTVESYAALLGILIGAGIFKVTSDAWALTGPSVIFGYFVLAPAILATSVAYSVFLSTPLGREPGGEYTHLSRTFGGYGIAFVAVWLKIISYIGALAYLARAFADYVCPSMWTAVGALAFFYAIHVAGVRWFGRIQVAMCAMLGVSLIFLIGPGLFAVHPANYQPFFAHGLRGFAASLPPLFFAYAGFESLAQTAGEVRDSTSRLPRVFLRGISATMVIYLLMSIVAFGVLSGSEIAGSSASMSQAASHYLPFGAAWIVTLGAIMALATSLNATMLVPSRVAIMLAGDGLAPRWLGAISPRTGTPVIGLTMTFALALILLVSGKVSLALNIAVFALVVLYFLHSIALLLLPRLNPQLYAQVTVRIPRPLQVASAVLSIVMMGFIIVEQFIDSFATIELAFAWAVSGAIVFAVSHRGAARRIENAQQA